MRTASLVLAATALLLGCPTQNKSEAEGAAKAKGADDPAPSVKAAKEAPPTPRRVEEPDPIPDDEPDEVEDDAKDEDDAEPNETD